MCATGLNSQERKKDKCWTASRYKRTRAARLPAKAELKLSEFLATADGGRRERPIEKMPSKMFILFSKTKEKTNAYGGRGRWDTLPHLLSDRKQWGSWKTWMSFNDKGHRSSHLFMWEDSTANHQRVNDIHLKSQDAPLNTIKFTIIFHLCTKSC